MGTKISMVGCKQGTCIYNEVGECTVLNDTNFKNGGCPFFKTNAKQKNTKGKRVRVD